MYKKYPRLSSLLKHPDSKVKIFEAYKENIKELSKIESLISELESLECKGLDTKFKDINEVNKFESTVSEIKVAKILLDNKHKTELISDNDSHFYKKKGDKTPSPDIRCIDSSLTTYIEVARINENTDIEDLIIENTKDFLKCIRYRIDVHLKKRLSIPVMGRCERDVLKKLTFASINSFKESLYEAILTHEFPTTPIDTDDITFELKETTLEKGYIGLIDSEPVDTPEGLIKYFQSILCKKNKRKGFGDVHKKNPFIIAIDLQTMKINPLDVKKTLYGEVAQFSTYDAGNGYASNLGMSNEAYKKWVQKNYEKEKIKIHQSESWKKIEKAKSRGWDSFLSKRNLIPNDELCYLISKEGKFISDKMNDVSAVLLIDHKGKCFFYPNPFCSDEINDPKMEIFINVIEDA